MNKKKQKRSERKPYSKPEFRRVQLNPEESLAGGCKLDNAAAASVSQCNLNFCFSSGS